MTPDVDVDVAVIGAGITGLATARQLRDRGLSVTCLDRADDPGGVVRSRRVEGRVLELGPQRLRATPQILDLAEALGIADGLVEGPADLPLAVYRDGALRRAPLSPGGFVATDLLSLRGKLRFLLEPLTGGPQDGDTVASYLERSFGREAATAFLGPLYGGIYGSDPGAMPIEHSLGRLLDERGVGRSALLWAARRWLGGAEVPPPVTFEDGLQRLPEAMRDTLGDGVRLGVAARAVERRDDRRGLVVRTADGAVAAGRVVVATAADDAAALLRDLDARTASALDDLRYNPLGVVHLDADTGGDWMGYQVALDEDLVTRGVTWNDALFGRDGIHTCFLGGATAPEAVEWSDEELGATAAREFEEVTEATAEVLNVHRTRMPAFDGSWDALADLETPEGVTVAGNYTGRAGIPGRLRQAERIAEAIAGDGGRAASGTSPGGDGANG